MRFSFSLRNTSFVRGFFVAFVLGFVVRLIPEVLSYPHPIGFDTIFYAWRIESGVVLYHWSQLFSSWWLFFALLIPVYNFLQVDPFLLLKLTAPLLFALNTCGIYYFARKALSWTAKKAVFAAFFFSFQMAALAISWHFYRNMLGLGVLLFALPWIKNSVKGFREFGIFVFLSVLVVFSHEFGSVILLVVVLGFLLNSLLRGERRESVKILTAASLAFALFSATVCLAIFPVQYAVDTNVIQVYQPSGHYEGPLFFFANYLTVYDTVQHYPTYFDLVAHVLSLFAMLYIVVLPLALVGFFRDKVLDWWTGWLLVGSLGLLITPFMALEMWSRWMLMLVYPFSFYAVNGITKALASGGQSVGPDFRWVSSMKLSKRVVKPILVLSFSLGLMFMCTPLFYGRAGVFGLPTTVSYVPSTMQSNSVPLVDVGDTIRVMKWLDEHMDKESVLLAQDAFFWYAKLYLDDWHTLVYFKHDIEGSIYEAIERGYREIYFVWWNEDIGWYGFAVPESFGTVRSSGRISAFEYSGEMVWRE